MPDPVIRFWLEQGLAIAILWGTYRFITGDVWKWFTQSAFKVLTDNAQQRTAALAATAAAITRIETILQQHGVILENHADQMRLLALYVTGGRLTPAEFDAMYRNHDQKQEDYKPNDAKHN